jgi:phage gp29-like protein
MYEFKLETPQSGRSNLDANTPIVRHKLDIMTSVLCDFLTMGHTSRGAQNLADTKVDLFMQAVEAWLNAIAAVINRHGLPRLWALNGMDRDLMPEIVPDLAQRVDLDVFSNMILRLSQAGMPLFPDPDLEQYVRDTAGLPDISEQDGYAAGMAADSGDDPQTIASKRARLEALIKSAVVRNLKRKRVA